MASVTGSVIRVDEQELRGHLDEVVRTSVEETLNGLLDAEADRLCQAKRYERTADRVDTRAGSLRAEAADEGRRGEAEGAAAAEPAVRDARSSSATGAANRASKRR